MTIPTIDFGGTCPNTVNLNEAANISVSVADDLSGVALQSAPNGSSPLDTSTVGDQTFTVTAEDVAGNENSNVCECRGIYDFSGTGGFGPPLAGSDQNPDGFTFKPHEALLTLCF